MPQLLLSRIDTHIHGTEQYPPTFPLSIDSRVGSEIQYSSPCMKTLTFFREQFFSTLRVEYSFYNWVYRHI